MLKNIREIKQKSVKQEKVGERGGEGEMYGKSYMETYITVCKIDSQQEFAVWLRKLKQVFSINLEGWDGEGDEREIQKGEDICIHIAYLS